MGQQFSEIADQHRVFMERQKIFFVASAATKGRVNVSPKGMATLRVLGANEVAYLDCTGSGSETRAHLLASADKRLTIMFCAFEGAPLILRLYGRGQSLMRGTPEYGVMLKHFEDIPGARQIVLLEVDLVQTSCGMGVPLFNYEEDRQHLVRHWVRQGAENVGKYWRLKNMYSIDGLPTQFEPDTMCLPPWGTQAHDRCSVCFGPKSPKSIPSVPNASFWRPASTSGLIPGTDIAPISRVIRRPVNAGASRRPRHRKTALYGRSTKSSAVAYSRVLAERI